jgi:hypothetical protein
MPARAALQVSVPLPTVAGDVKDIISAFSTTLANLDLSYEVVYIYLSNSLVHPNALCIKAPGSA